MKHPCKLWLGFLVLLCCLNLSASANDPQLPLAPAHIESLFAPVKTAPASPAVFPTLEEARAYFRRFFHWYNEEHVHTRIGMVTPSQKHSGEWKRILAEREAINVQTFAARRAYNRALGDQHKVVRADIS